MVKDACPLFLDLCPLFLDLILQPIDPTNPFMDAALQEDVIDGDPVWLLSHTLEGESELMSSAGSLEEPLKLLSQPLEFAGKQYLLGQQKCDGSSSPGSSSPGNTSSGNSFPGSSQSSSSFRSSSSTH